MTGTVALHDDPERWLSHEVAVLGFLAPSGLAVAPSPLIDPGPYRSGGHWMTCWEWVEHRGRAELRDPQRLGRALRLLHDRLGELGETVFGVPWPAQTLHGDASLSNLLRGGSGRLVWNDFEDTFRGPVHWDVAGYLASLEACGADAAFVAAALAAYGGLDREELAPFTAAHRVYDEIWRLYDAQRRS